MVFASMTAFAQRDMAKMTPEARAENQTRALTKNLNLTRAQKMEEMRNSRDADRSKMKDSMEGYNKELSKVLTPEQQEKYKTTMEERRKNGGMGRGPRK